MTDSRIPTPEWTPRVAAPHPGGSPIDTPEWKALVEALRRVAHRIETDDHFDRLVPWYGRTEFENLRLSVRVQFDRLP